MKTLHLSLIVLVVIISLDFVLPPAQADDPNGISIQNISVQPNAVKVGDSFTVTATLVNNSTAPIVLETGKCSIEDKQVPFFTVTFDNHAKIKAKNINCAGVGWSQLLDPGKKITGTSPDYTLTYTAAEPGTANVTVKFLYYVKNQTDSTQPNIEQTISKSFHFLIHDVNETYAQKPPAYFASPLKQFKSGITANDIKCNQGLQLIIKSEDNSPACVKPDTAQKLIERGWALNDTNMVSKESISLSAYQGVSNETFYNNGTVASDFTIDVNINNFKPSNASLVLQVYYNDGTLYKTVSVPSGMIQPDGFYKYQLIAVSDKNHPVPFKVVATYNQETAITYARVFAHP